MICEMGQQRHLLQEAVVKIKLVFILFAEKNVWNVISVQLNLADDLFVNYNLSLTHVFWSHEERNPWHGKKQVMLRHEQGAIPAGSAWIVTRHVFRKRDC